MVIGPMSVETIASVMRHFHKTHSTFRKHARGWFKTIVMPIPPGVEV